MKTPNQKQIWDKIAPEWNEFRNKPGEGIIKFLEKNKGNILDLGCGSGRNLVKIKEGKMYLVDFSKEMIKLAKKRAKTLKITAEFKVADSTKIPFKNNFFNGAICIALLHCMKKTDAEKTLKELYRVLKPGAKAKIAVWNKNSKWFKNREKETKMNWRNKGLRYLYLYKPKEFYDLIKNAGFKISHKFTPDKNIVLIIEKP